MGSQRRPQLAEAAVGHRQCQMQVVLVDSRRHPQVVEVADGMSISLGDF